MKWFLGALLGLIIAFGIYGIVGAICNLIIGPLLGYRIQQCSFFGVAIINENGRCKFALSEFRFIPEVLLDVNVTSKAKKLILDVFPVVLGFIVGMAMTSVFGGVRGIGRHVLIGTLSAMAILYCWHIFIVLKMVVYMRENGKK